MLRNRVAVMRLRPYLDGTKFTIWTNHNYLQWIVNLADGTGMLAQWWLRWSEFYFDIIDRAGIKNQATDALSRLVTGGQDYIGIKGDFPVGVVDLNEEKNEASKASTCTVFQVYDNKN